MDKDELAAQFVQLKVITVFKREEGYRPSETYVMKQDIMNRFSKRSRVPVARLRFTYEGRRIRGGETPKSLGLGRPEQDDWIDVFREQPWE